MNDVIDDFKKIAETGDLPPGYRWDSIEWRLGAGWMGWCWGPKGANDWIPVRKMPTEALQDIGIAVMPNAIDDNGDLIAYRVSGSAEEVTWDE